jgi:hypothetical protein
MNIKLTALAAGLVILLSHSAYSQCACCAGAASASGDFNTGIFTLPKKQFVLETYADFRTIRDGNNGMPLGDMEAPLKNMLITSFGVRYGLSDKITLSALLPYTFLHTNYGNDRGIGDAMLLGTFEVFAHENTRVALQAGIELPTGVQKSSNFDNTTVIVGSGSYDPAGGILAAYRWGKFSLQGNVFYKYTTKGFQGNYYSSVFVQNVTLSYRIAGAQTAFCSKDPKLAAKNNFGLNVFGGYSGESLDKLKEDGIADENSGYYLGFATLGVNLFYNKWGIPFTFSQPIFQHLNGDQNQAGYRIKVGIVRSF